MFMFCTAAPEAPFPRLSKRAVTVVFSSLPHTTSYSLFVPDSAFAYSVRPFDPKGATLTSTCPA